MQNIPRLRDLGGLNDQGRHQAQDLGVAGGAQNEAALQGGGLDRLGGNVQVQAEQQAQAADLGQVGQPGVGCADQCRSLNDDSGWK